MVAAILRPPQPGPPSAAAAAEPEGARPTKERGVQNSSSVRPEFYVRLLKLCFQASRRSPVASLDTRLSCYKQKTEENLPCSLLTRLCRFAMSHTVDIQSIHPSAINRSPHTIKSTRLTTAGTVFNIFRYNTALQRGHLQQCRRPVQKIAKNNRAVASPLC